MTRANVETAAPAPEAGNCHDEAVESSIVTDGNRLLIVVDGAASTYKHSSSVSSDITAVPLVAGNTWHYRAYAVNSKGPSTVASNIASARVATGPRTATMGAPTDLRVVWGATNTTGSLYWNWPKDYKGTAFEVQESSSSNFPSTGPDEAVVSTATVASLDAVSQDTVGATKTGEAFLYYRVRAGTDGNWSTRAVRPSRDDDNEPATTGDVPAIYPVNGSDAANEPTAVPADGEDGYTAIDLKWTPNLGTDDDPIDRPSGYEIDRRTGEGPWQPLEPDTTYTSSEYTDVDLMPETLYTYRIFPLYSSVRAGTSSVTVYGMPIEVDTSTLTPSSPDPIRGLRVTADGPTAFNLEWDRVTETGGADIKFYYIQVVDDGDKDLVIDVAADATNGTQWAEANGAGKGRTAADTTEYNYKPIGDDALNGGDVRWFRVFPISQANSMPAGDEDDPMDDMVTDAELDKVAATPKRGQTDAAASPEPPADLSAETARDSSGKEVPDRGVLLIWNMPDNPEGATIAHYVVERKKDAGAWEEIGKTSAGSPDERTYFNDRDKQVAGELRTYRVAAVSNTDAQSDWSNEAGLMDGVPYHMHEPTAHTAPSIREPVFVARGLVEVEWTPGDNNGTHIALLWDEEANERVGGLEYDTHMNNREAFLNVPTGTYSVAVISYNANGTPRMTYDFVTGVEVE